MTSIFAFPFTPLGMHVPWDNNSLTIVYAVLLLSLILQKICLS